MNKLRKSLSTNAIFSGVSGLTLILFNKQISILFAISQGTVFWIIGIALVLFAGTIVLEIFKQRPLAVLWIIVQDFIWVIGSILLLLLQPFDISSLGNSCIAIVAITVLFMALNQSAALAQVDSTTRKGVKQLSFKRTIASTKSKVWTVISDVGNYHRVAPNIDDVTIISGSAKGMIRSCSHGEDSWTETCSVWEEEKTYSFVVNTSAPGYPYPLALLQGTWNVLEIDTNLTEIEMIFDFKYKKKLYNLLHPFIKIKFKKVANELLDNWQAMIEHAK